MRFVVFIFIFLAHVSYLNNGFTWLDHGDIEQKRAVLTVENLVNAFSTPFGETGFYRPLGTIVHSLDAALYGTWAPGFHFTNVLLHVFVTIAFALFLSQFLPLTPSATQITVLTAGVHPLSYLPIGAISYRPELLVGLFVFLTLYFHAKARTNRLMRNVIWTSFCALLACFAKESGPILIIGLIAIWEMTTSQKRLSKTVFFFEILAIISYLVLRFWAVPNLWHIENAPLALNQAVGTRLASLGIFMMSLALPTRPTLSDATPICGLANQSAWITGFVIIAAIGAMMRLGCKSRWTPILLFIGLALSPVLNVVPLPRFRSPHYAYVATFGMSMVVGLIFQIVQEKKKTIRTTVRLAIAFWLSMATVTTLLAGLHFKNDQTLFEPEVTKDPYFLEGHFYLGDYYKKTGQINRAAEAYLSALKVDSHIIAYIDATATLINLGEIRLIQNRLDEAEQLLSTAAKGASVDQAPLIAYNRALIASQQRLDDRVVALLTVPGLQWNRPEPFLLLAQAQKHLGQTDAAINTLRRSLPFLNKTQRQQIETLIDNTTP